MKCIRGATRGSSERIKKVADLERVTRTDARSASNRGSFGLWDITLLGVFSRPYPGSGRGTKMQVVVLQADRKLAWLARKLLFKVLQF